MTLDVMALVDDTGLNAQSVEQVSSSYAFPFGRYDAFLVLALVALVILTFNL